MKIAHHIDMTLHPLVCFMYVIILECIRDIFQCVLIYGYRLALVSRQSSHLLRTGTGIRMCVRISKLVFSPPSCGQLGGSYGK